MWDPFIFSAGFPISEQWSSHELWNPPYIWAAQNSWPSNDHGSLLSMLWNPHVFVPQPTLFCELPFWFPLPLPPFPFPPPAPRARHGHRSPRKRGVPAPAPPSWARGRPPLAWPPPDVRRALAGDLSCLGGWKTAVGVKGRPFPDGDQKKTACQDQSLFQSSRCWRDSAESGSLLMGPMENPSCFSQNIRYQIAVKDQTLQIQQTTWVARPLFLRRCSCRFPVKPTKRVT